LNRHEKNISAIGQKAEKQTRLQGKNVDQEWPQGFSEPQGYRQEKTDCVRRKEITSFFIHKYLIKKKIIPIIFFFLFKALFPVFL
jgi:hypothetical protein